MVDAIEGDVAAIATFGAPGGGWNKRLPTHDLTPRGLRFAAGTKIKWIPGLGDRKLREILDQSPVDSVFCHYMNFAVGFRRVWDTVDVPLYIHCHGYDITWDMPSPSLPFLRRFSRNYIHKAIRLASRAQVIVNSEQARHRLIQDGFPEKRIVVKYIGVPVPSELPRPSGESTEIQVLYLGRLIDCKGPDLTIRAFEIACRQGFNGRLTIAGD